MAFVFVYFFEQHAEKYFSNLSLIISLRQQKRNKWALYQ